MKQKKVFIFSHVHWDREWYKTFQEFRFDVVEVVDRVLDLLQAGEYDYFILDGQTVVLEDYLEIRPDLKKKIASWVSSGRMIIGPWYILPDEFLVSGESLIRNLLVGKKICSDFGKIQQIGYLPDMFGHISQMPQILRGFGIERAVLWRGADPKKDLFIWRGADQSEVLTVHLTDGYYNTFLINYQQQKKDLPEQLKKLADKAYGDLILFPNGGDHLAPVNEIRNLISQMNKEYPEYHFSQETLESYFNQLKVNYQNLSVISGELRTLVPRAYILPGVFSARMYLKQKNHHLQMLISNWVEPLSSISWLLGNAYKQGFIDLVWKYLLLNQPHDSICGCSTDPVHQEMLQRYQAAEEVCNKLIRNSLKNIADSLIADKEHNYLVVFNMSNWSGNGVYEFNFDFPATEKVTDFVLSDLSGNNLPYEIIEQENTKKFVSEIDVLPDWQEITRYKIQTEINEIKPFGYKFIKIEKNKKSNNIFAQKVKIGLNYLENDFLRLNVVNKSLRLTNLLNGEEFIVNTFEDSGDAGDEYNYSPPKKDISVRAEIISTEIETQNKLSATLKVTYNIDIPEKLTENRQERSEDVISQEIVSYVRINAGDPVLYFRTVFDNRAEDHRLRVRFGRVNPKKEIKCFHDVQFGVVEKPAGANSRGFDVEKYQERVEETFTVQSFATLEQNAAGISIFSRGLPEFELVSVNEKVKLALTLLRCVGWLSRDDLRTRGGGAGPMFATPDAQCQGLSVFEYAVLPYQGEFSKSETLKRAAQYISGFQSIYHVPVEKTLISLENSLFSLMPETLSLSALKRSENQDGIIFRFFNPFPFEQKFSLTPTKDFSFHSVYLVRLDETLIKEVIKDRNGTFSGIIAPYEIITLNFLTSES